MFKRCKKPTILRRVREFVWPSMGWSRLFAYYRLRMGRLPGTAYYVAAGFASGVSVSFTPFMGLHLILGFLLARLVRGSVLASVIGTFVGNPWTFPIIWVVTYKIGIFVLGVPVENGAPEAVTLSLLWEKPMDVLLPMVIGGLPLSIVAWMVAFFSVRDIIHRHKTRRLRKLRKALLKQFKKKSAEVKST